MFDRDHERLHSRLNPDLVDAVRPDMGGLEEVRWLVERHAELTGSRRAAMLLDHWAKATAHVWHAAQGPGAAVRGRPGQPGRQRLSPYPVNKRKRLNPDLGAETGRFVIDSLGVMAGIAPQIPGAVTSP